MPLRHKDGGYSVVETVIIIPVAVIATLVIVQFGLQMLAHNAAQSAAQEGVRAARGYRGTAAHGQRAAAEYVHRVAPTLLRDLRIDSNRSPTTATVRVRADVLQVVPAVLGVDSFGVDETAAGPVERFVTGPG